MADGLTLEIAGDFRQYNPFEQPSAVNNIVQGVAQAVERLILVPWSTQASPAGERWPPLAASTVRDRRRINLGPTPILVRTGELRRSYQFPVISGQTISFGLRSPQYASFHQDGTGLPRRAFLPEGDLPLLWLSPIQEAVSRAIG